MSQRIDSPGYKSFEAGEAISLYTRVKLHTDGKIMIAAALADRDIGTLQTVAATAAGDWVPVKLNSAGGTHKVRVSEEVVVGTALFTETTGELQDTDAAGSTLWGLALEGTGTDNDVIEVMYGAQVDISHTH